MLELMAVATITVLAVIRAYGWRWGQRHTTEGLGMKVACVDLEGVLIPELWPCLASRTGQSELSLTSREIPDYSQLVARRIDMLRSCGLRLDDVRQLLEDIRPLPGAMEFLEALGQEFRIVLVSDAFEQMVQTLWARLGCPELRCHRFQCDVEGYVIRPNWRRSRGKHEEVEALAGEGAWVFATGDAFNDLSMLRSADLGVLFRPSIQTAAAAKDIVCAYSYDELLAILRTADVRRRAVRAGMSANSREQPAAST